MKNYVEETSPTLKRPILMKTDFNEGYIVVCFYDINNPDLGTVVYKSDNITFYSIMFTAKWNLERFVPFNGRVVLEND